MKVLGIVVCFLCVNFLEASTAYQAGIYYNTHIKSEEIIFVCNEAAKSAVDILVLPSLDSSVGGDNYSEIVKTLSTAAKESNLYLVAHLYEHSLCQNNIETVRNNVVFDRKGSIISVYRKPISSSSNCSISTSDLVTFTTDFGVTFGLLMEEDVVLHKPEYMKGLKNFVVTGEADGMLFKAVHFFPSWSYVNNVNLLSSKGVYGGKSDLKTSYKNLEIVTLDKTAGPENPASVISSSEFSNEDINQYSIKILDLKTSAQGYTETVCFGAFCCGFSIKTRITGQDTDISYVMAAFDGVQPLTNQHSIGVQSCMLFADIKNINELRPNYNTNVIFNKITITANDTKQNSQYPILQSSSVSPTEKFKFSGQSHSTSNLVTSEIVDIQNLLKFGIFGRNYAKDCQTYNSNVNSLQSTNDLIYNEDVQEWFDYVWIRLRILLVVISLYVLEMM